MNIKKLNYKFFNQPTLKIAEKLLGKTIIFNNKAGIIVETEAYIGENDPACHAARGKTKRNAVMYEKGGISYVYLIYGMYHCLNFVTERKNFPAAVLIRGIKPIPYNFANSDFKTYNKKELILGPGKLCNHFGITREHSNEDITNSEKFYVIDTKKEFEHTTTTRIGISKGTNLPWRFIIDI